jgi:hypothetical protein
MQLNGWDHALKVTADGRGLLGHTGAILPDLFAWIGHGTTTRVRCPSCRTGHFFADVGFPRGGAGMRMLPEDKERQHAEKCRVGDGA